MNALTPSLITFQGFLLRDAALQASLATHFDEATFIPELVAAAAARGITITAEEVRNALYRPAPPLVTEAAGGLASATSLDLSGWIPARLIVGAPMLVEWIYLGRAGFAEPFFEQSLHRAAGLPLNRLFRFRTAFDALTHQAEQPHTPQPAGFIFHLSRCGSTLAARMLAARPDSVVLSEAEPIDAFIKLAPYLGDEAAPWLRRLVLSLGQPRRGDESKLFIKFDSWHILDLHLIERAFPDVPWLFLYRDPLEILVSHRRSAGSQMVPGLIPPHYFGLAETEAFTMPLDEYGAHVLKTLYQAALTGLQSGRGTALSYPRLMTQGASALLTGFNLPITPAILEAMQAEAVTTPHAKDTTRPFTPDSEDKQKRATPRERELSERVLAPLYAELERWNRTPYFP